MKQRLCDRCGNPYRDAATEPEPVAKTKPRRRLFGHVATWLTGWLLLSIGLLHITVYIGWCAHCAPDGSASELFLCLETMLLGISTGVMLIVGWVGLAETKPWKSFR